MVRCQAEQGIPPERTGSYVRRDSEATTPQMAIHGQAPRISVIIPTWDEAARIEAAIEAVAVLRPHEILVVDGGSRDGTPALAAGRPCRVIASPRGRAVQMNAEIGRAHV